MQRFRWIGLQGSSRGLLPPLLLFVFLITTSGIPALAADVPAACGFPVARIVSIQGSIQVLRAYQNNWSRITRLDTALCEGDKLRTGASSRAALFIQPETLVRVDQSTNVFVSQTAKETLVEFTQDDIVATSTAAHTCGGGYFITRFPHKLRVNTPHLNAAVEGTEFLVAMRCEATELSVFEGKVLATSAGSNDFPSQSVVSGQTLTVGGAEPPAIKLNVKPADAVQWTLYYPPITPAGTEPVVDCLAVAKDTRVLCLIARAEQLLRAGRVDEAQANIADALAVAPSSSDAKALSSIISLVKNEKAEALRLAKEAVDATPDSAPAWLALSYAQQADFKLEAALTSAQRATGLMPSNALALARVAELQLSLGWTREAEKSARRAVAASASESRAQMILGFVHLAQIDVNEARGDFERAIELDSTDPLSRLGLGLAIIRAGKLVEGREQLEIAAALDPANSLLRSYVGKAYYEENSKERDELASTQFGLAKQIDPNDPTPWFYDAILKDIQTRPVEALYDLETSAVLNGDRAVYRSTLLLDQDFAARSISTATIYNELGFSQLGLAKAADSLALDEASPSAHRFLADIYATLPRHDIARASELLQAQLRQPLGSPPLQPQLANDLLFKNNFYGPTSVGFGEFNPLFIRDRTEVQAFGVYGDPKLWGQQVVVNGLYGPVSLSVSEFSAYDFGYRPNNDDTRRQYDGFVQMQIAPQTSFQFEATHSTRDFGDLQSNFLNLFDTSARRNASDETYRFGIRQAIDASSDLLISLIQQNREGSLNINDPLNPITVNDFERSWKAEMQYLNKQGSFQTLLGASFFEAKSTEESLFPAFLFSDTVHSTPHHINLYGYLYAPLFTPALQAQLGVSYDHLSTTLGDQEEANPKIGVIWKPTTSVRLRTAYFKVLKRRISSDQGLEPTQLAGFNQLYDDPNGTISEGGNVGADIAFSRHVSAGFEVSRRSLKVPFSIFGEVSFQRQVEESVGGYFYWLPTDRLAISFQPRYQEFEAGALFSQIYLTELPLSFRLFLPEGLWLGAVVTGVSQSGRFSGSGGDFHASDQFLLTDATIAYRLSERRGTISIQATNIFNKHFQFQEIDLDVPPRYIPDRRAVLRISLQF